MAIKTEVPVTPSGGSTLPLEENRSAGTAEPGVQGSAIHGFRKDDALKRIIRRHPQKGIPQVEGLEPKEAPPKE